jgi:hypothetical protein
MSSFLFAGAEAATKQFFVRMNQWIVLLFELGLSFQAKFKETLMFKFLEMQSSGFISHPDHPYLT